MKKIVDYKHRASASYEHIHEDMSWGNLVGTVLIVIVMAQALVGFLQ